MGRARQRKNGGGVAQMTKLNINFFKKLCSLGEKRITKWTTIEDTNSSISDPHTYTYKYTYMYLHAHAHIQTHTKF